MKIEDCTSIIELIFYLILLLDDQKSRGQVFVIVKKENHR